MVKFPAATLLPATAVAVPLIMKVPLLQASAVLTVKFAARRNSVENVAPWRSKAVTVTLPEVMSLFAVLLIMIGSLSERTLLEATVRAGQVSELGPRTMAVVWKRGKDVLSFFARTADKSCTDPLMLQSPAASYH